MVIKRKMLLMQLYSKLVKAGKFHTAKGVLQYLIGIDRSRYMHSNIRFWCLIFDINFNEWFSND